jgi:hypothetical protein
MVPAVEEKVPAVQGKGKHMPANGHSVPAGHTSHVMDAAFRVNWPAAHAVQTAEPGTDVKEPDSQGASTLAEDEFVN